MIRASFRRAFLPLAAAELATAGMAASIAATPAVSQQLEMSALYVVSSDSTRVPHAEVHLSMDPTRPARMIAAAGVYPDSAPHRVDVFETLDGGVTWSRSRLPIPDEVGLRAYIDPWTAFSPGGAAYVAVLGFVEGEGPGLATWIFQATPGDPSWSLLTVADGPDGGSYDQPKILVPEEGTVALSVQRWGTPTRNRNTTTVLELIEVDAASGRSGIRQIDRNNVMKNSMNLVPTMSGGFLTGYYGWMIGGTSERLGLLWTLTDLAESPTNLATTHNGMGMGWLASNPASGDSAIYLVFPSDAGVLSMMRSDDDGERWSEAVSVIDVPTGSFVLSNVAVDGAGRVAVAWTVLVSRAHGTECYQTYAAVSEDRGSSFGPPYALSDEISCLPVPGSEVFQAMSGDMRNTNQGRGRGGEYFGLVGLDEGFYVAWADALDGVLQILGRRFDVRRP